MYADRLWDGTVVDKQEFKWLQFIIILLKPDGISNIAQCISTFIITVKLFFCVQFDTLPQNDLTASVSDALRDTVRIFSSEAPPPHQLPPLATELEESSRAAAPLALAHAPNYVKDRIVLIG